MFLKSVLYIYAWSKSRTPPSVRFVNMLITGLQLILRVSTTRICTTMVTKLGVLKVKIREMFLKWVHQAGSSHSSFFFFVLYFCTCFQNKLDRGVGGCGLANPIFFKFLSFSSEKNLNVYDVLFSPPIFLLVVFFHSQKVSITFPYREVMRSSPGSAINEDWSSYTTNQGIALTLRTRLLWFLLPETAREFYIDIGEVLLVAGVLYAHLSEMTDKLLVVGLLGNWGRLPVPAPFIPVPDKGYEEDEQHYQDHHSQYNEDQPQEVLVILLLVRGGLSGLGGGYSAAVTICRA